MTKMKRTYRLDGLDCAHCAAKLEAAAGKLPGVLDAHINFLTQKLTLELEASADTAAIEAGVCKAAEAISCDIELKRV